MERETLKAKTKLILVTGGARSGKSAFAEEYAQAAALEGKVAYIATAQVWDEEMKFRVRKHKERRPASWQTFEAPTEEMVLAALKKAGKSHEVILFDCLTIYLSNFLCNCTEDELQNEALLYERVKDMSERIIAALSKMSKTCALIMVTNEVGTGIVPENHLARVYRDLAGLMNQRLADAADAVYLSVCGQAVNLKKLAVTAPEAARGDLGSFEECSL